MINEELYNWCQTNRIPLKEIDNDVVEIDGFGKLFVEDTDKLKSIFRTNADGEIKFNSMEDPQILAEEEIYYIVFKFGNNWYWFDTRGDFKMNILKYIGNRLPDTLENAPEFVNLGVHSPYELLSGSFGLNDWCKKAKYMGQKALGICDYNTMAGTLVLQNECKAAGLKHIFGYSLTFIDNNGTKVGAKVYCQTQHGMKNLLRIQKVINVDNAGGPIDFYTFLSYGKGNVVVLDKYSSNWILDNQKLVDEMREDFDKLFFQVDFSEFKAERIDVVVLDSAKLYFNKIYQKLDVPPVLIQDCYYMDKDDAKNKIILNKIATGAAHEQSNDQYFKSVSEHFESFSQIFDSERWNIRALFDECCKNTVVIAEGAEASYATDRNFMPQYMMTEEETKKFGSRHNMFLQLLEEGFKKLVPEGKEEEYRKRLDYEIYILESTNNIDYMLVQYDTVNWARENGILVGAGRGSAGGALVLYLLGITLIDPIKYNLIFERFLLPERAGLYAAQATIIGQDIDSQEYVEVELENGRTYKIDKDAQLLIKGAEGEEPFTVYADELEEGDDIIFDNRDLIFTLNEI